MTLGNSEIRSWVVRRSSKLIPGISEIPPVDVGEELIQFIFALLFLSEIPAWLLYLCRTYTAFTYTPHGLISLGPPSYGWSRV